MCFGVFDFVFSSWASVLIAKWNKTKGSQTFFFFLYLVAFRYFCLRVSDLFGAIYCRTHLFIVADRELYYSTRSDDCSKRERERKNTHTAIKWRFSHQQERHKNRNWVIISYWIAIRSSQIAFQWSGLVLLMAIHFPFNVCAYFFWTQSLFSLSLSLVEISNVVNKPVTV